MNREEKKNRRKIRKTRKDSPKYKLRVLWRKRRNDFSVRDLLSVAREIDYPEIQKSALREFLDRDNLAFADFYRALALSGEILSLDPNLKDKIWEKCLDISTPDNLRELIDLGEAKAAKELFKRIDQKSMSMSKAKQILISLFEKSSDKRIREEYWKRIEAIGLNEDELKYLLDLNQTSILHRYIEKMLAKRAKKKTGEVMGKIKELVAQIKQRQE